MKPIHQFETSTMAVNRSGERPGVQADRSLLLPGRHRHPAADRPLLEQDHQEWRQTELLRLVQGQVGRELADHPARPDRRHGRRRQDRPTRLRGHDGNGQDRHREDQGRREGRAIGDGREAASRASSFRVFGVFRGNSPRLRAFAWSLSCLSGYFTGILPKIRCRPRRKN